MAPRPKLTPAVHRVVVDALRLGATVAVAAATARIGKTTLYDWLERGEEDNDPDSKYTRLFLDCENARAERVLEALRIVKDRKSQWTAAAWFPERSDPRHWGRRPPDTDAVAQVTTNVRVMLPDNGRDPVTPDPNRFVQIFTPADHTFPRPRPALPDPEDDDAA